MRVLFKSGTIYDGTGSEPAKGDVVIEGDRIVKVGGRIDDPEAWAKNGFSVIRVVEQEEGAILLAEKGL